MAKKPAKAPETTCEQGGVAKVPDQITVAKGHTITFESWVCKGAGEVRLWIDPPAQLGDATMVFHKQSTGPTPLPLKTGKHWLLWMMASPSPDWQWRSQITTTDAAATTTVRALHRMTAATTNPPVLASLEVVVK